MKRLLSFFHFISQYLNAKGALRKEHAPKTKEETLPAIASRFNEAAGVIYGKVLLEQFRDYEERYGPGLVACLQDAEKTALIGTIKSFMLYTFFRHLGTIPLTPDDALSLTCRLEKQMGARGAPRFVDYVHYHNPHFEDATMAPAFKFGNDIGEIVGRIDRPFSFMASQQAIIIAEITKQLLAVGSGAERGPTGDPESTHPTTEGMMSVDPVEPTAIRSSAVIAKGVKYFGWWFAWGLFSGIMILIVLKGGGLGWDGQLFVILSTGVFSGTVAWCCHARKVYPQ